MLTRSRSRTISELFDAPSSLSISEMASSESDHDTQPSIDSVEEKDFFEEFFESDDRLAGIFGIGKLSMSKPSKNRPGEVDKLVVSSPTTTIKERVSKFEKFSRNFSSANTRAEFLREACADASTQHTVSFTYADKPMKLGCAIEEEAVRNTTVVKIGKNEVTLPVIKNGYLSTYQQKFSAYLRTLLDKICDLLDGLGTTCNVPESIQRLRQEMAPVAASMCNTTARRACQAELCAILIAEIYLQSQSTTIAQYFVIEDLKADEYTRGAYVRVSDVESTPELRLSSMVQRNAVGFDTNPVYNLNMAQLTALLTYAFSRDVQDRLRAKVRLLSSVSSVVRNDLIDDPEKVIHATMREYFFTREELIHLFFIDESDRRAARCLCCGKIGAINGTRIQHSRCEAMQWLASHYQFTADEDITHTHEYMYVRPGVTEVARSLAQAQKRIHSMSFIGSDDKEAVAYVVGKDGLPRKLGSAGVRWTYPTMASAGHTKK